MASPLKRQREPTYSEDLAQQIDDETGEPLELPVLQYSQEALEEVIEHAKTAKSDKVYKCNNPYHFGLCQFWNVPAGYKPKAVLYPTAKKWI